MSPKPRLSAGLRAIHLALLALCLVAWVTGLFAGDYKKPLHLGYDLHKRASGLARALKEVHEAAEVIIPAYLVLHVGGVVAHALGGHPLWRDMFFLGAKPGDGNPD